MQTPSVKYFDSGVSRSYRQRIRSPSISKRAIIVVNDCVNASARHVGRDNGAAARKCVTVAFVAAVSLADQGVITMML
jgi:hypothetical protein